MILAQVFLGKFESAPSIGEGLLVLELQHVDLGEAEQKNRHVWVTGPVGPLGHIQRTLILAARLFESTLADQQNPQAGQGGSELWVLPNYPADEVDPTMTNPSSEVVGDTIVEFKRDGTVVRELKLFDILDPYRVSYESLSNFWNTSYPASGDTEDWSHANALVFDPSDNTYIVSVRHQDVVIKIERDTGKLVWLLGDPGRWNAPWNNSLLMPRLGAQFEFNYHQHAPEITASGNILLFDNGNNRAIPPVPPLPFDASYSRAVEYQIDPVTMTFEQVWAYGGMFDPGHSFYSFFLGDANQLPVTGNVLVTDGGKRNANLLRFGRIAEVTHASPPREVFELIIRDHAAVDPVHYAVYRSHRLPSLY